jgi:hypothetical protein
MLSYLLPLMNTLFIRREILKQTLNCVEECIDVLNLVNP